jgi:LytS/YehU family sensor histidine kinase
MGSADRVRRADEGIGGGERRDESDERPAARWRRCARYTLHPKMQASTEGTPALEARAAPVSVHFVNNVLAAAASYIEVEPETARDVLADLGAFLSHRLRQRPSVGLAEELAHVATYVRLEQARFPDRIEAELPANNGLPAGRCAPGDVQAPVSRALDGWLQERPGRVRLALRARLDGETLELLLDQPDDSGAAHRRVRIPIGQGGGAT